ncbi:MAG TPA: DedA family protein [Burkholderiales bacterium]|nr:DedA family protein [Burkholderiales bacterium]
MELLSQFLEVILHLDLHLRELAQTYGAWIYGILFLIIFCETGVVVTPFLPGDSLLFVAGTIAAAGHMNIHALALLLTAAAIAGDSLNYSIGRYLGPKVFRFDESRFFKRAYIDRTRAFFDRHGGKAIILARFVPIVRTYAPFVAGIGAMQYSRFLMFNVTGAVLWVVLLSYAGFFFGNLPVVRDNLTAVILGIIFLSIMPGAVELWRAKQAR